MRLSFDLPPSLNSLYRYGRGKVYLSPEGHTYKEYVRLLATHQGATIMEGALAVSLWFYNSRMDSDNGQKVLLDSLQGIAYHNDAQIIELHIYKRQDEDEPRVDIEIERLS